MGPGKVLKAWRVRKVSPGRRDRRGRLARSGAQNEKPFLPTTLMEYLQIVGGALAMASAIAAAGGFLITRNDLRVERTLRLFERFDSEALLAAQKDLAAISAKATSLVERIDESPGLDGLSPEELGAQRAKLIVAAAYVKTESGQDDLASSVGQVVGFFDGLNICVERAACDADTAHAFFDGYAVAFWETFGPVIAHERANRRPGFGRGMEEFIQSGRGR